MSQSVSNSPVLALTGGVGGAKLCTGLAALLPPGELDFVVNTGDDFEHLGLHISPDIDSLVYALSGHNDQERGWGLAGESWNFLAAVADLGGESWFALGDRDLAMHVLRTRMLAQGTSLTAATSQLARALGLQHAVLPMTDDPVRTMVGSKDGELAFQHYFVRDQCQPAVTGFRFAGIETARPNEQLLAHLANPELAGIIICPSNPYVSVDPILDLPGVRAAIKRSPAPVLAVSPIVGGIAIKGPAAKMMQELGVPSTPAAVARHYQGLIDCMVIDSQDADSLNEVQQWVPRVSSCQSIMRNQADREHLGRHCLDLLRELAAAPGSAP